MIWIDAQLSPAIAGWIRSELRIDCVAVREIGLRDSEDLEIFNAARNAGVVVMTKARIVFAVGYLWPASINHLAHVWKHIERATQRDSFANATGGG
jgi:hypothetical protein